MTKSHARVSILISTPCRRIHSLALRGPDDGRAPKTIKLFINQTAIDFDSAERGYTVLSMY